MLSTTANILKSSKSPLESLEVTFEQNLEQPNILINHLECPELALAIYLLNDDKIIPQFHLNPSHCLVPLNEILTAIKLMDNPPCPTSKQETLHLQIAKTYLMECVLRKLTRKKRSQSNKVVPAKSSTRRWLGFAMMTVIEFLPSLLGNILLSGDWLGSLAPYVCLLPFHIMTPLIVVSALTLVGGMICFAGPGLLRWIGLKCANKDLSLILNQQKQIDIANEIHFRLGTFNDISFYDYQTYCHFSNQMAEQITNSPIIERKQGYISKALTVTMVALTGIQSLSGAILYAAVVLGSITGALTMTTVSPAILTAFVASHMCGILALAVPFAISQTVVSYKLRISSAAKLFDPFGDDRKEVIRNRAIYIENQKSTENILPKFSNYKAKYTNLFDTEYTHKSYDNGRGTIRSNPREVTVLDLKSIDNKPHIETGILLVDLLSDESKKAIIKCQR